MTIRGLKISVRAEATLYRLGYKDTDDITQLSNEELLYLSQYSTGSITDEVLKKLSFNILDSKIIELSQGGKSDEIICSTLHKLGIDTIRDYIEKLELGYKNVKRNMNMFEKIMITRSYINDLLEKHNVSLKTYMIPGEILNIKIKNLRLSYQTKLAILNWKIYDVYDLICLDRKDFNANSFILEDNVKEIYEVLYHALKIPYYRIERIHNYRKTNRKFKTFVSSKVINKQIDVFTKALHDELILLKILGFVKVNEIFYIHNNFDDIIIFDTIQNINIFRMYMDRKRLNKIMRKIKNHFKIKNPPYFLLRIPRSTPFLLPYSVWILLKANPSLAYLYVELLQMIMIFMLFDNGEISNDIIGYMFAGYMESIKKYIKNTYNETININITSKNFKFQYIPKYELEACKLQTFIFNPNYTRHACSYYDFINMIKERKFKSNKRSFLRNVIIRVRSNYIYYFDENDIYCKSKSGECYDRDFINFDFLGVDQFTLRTVACICPVGTTWKEFVNVWLNTNITKNKRRKKLSGVHEVVSSIHINFLRETDNDVKNTFDFIKVQVGLIGDRELQRSVINNRIKEINKLVIDKINKSKRFNNYNIPINFLKIGSIILRNNSILEYTFELKKFT